MIRCRMDNREHGKNLITIRHEGRHLEDTVVALDLSPGKTAQIIVS